MLDRRRLNWLLAVTCCAVSLLCGNSYLFAQETEIRLKPEEAPFFEYKDAESPGVQSKDGQKTARASLEIQKVEVTEANQPFVIGLGAEVNRKTAKPPLGYSYVIVHYSVKLNVPELVVDIKEGCVLLDSGGGTIRGYGQADLTQYGMHWMGVPDSTHYMKQKEGKVLQKLFIVPKDRLAGAAIRFDGKKYPLPVIPAFGTPTPSAAVGVEDAKIYKDQKLQGEAEGVEFGALVTVVEDTGEFLRIRLEDGRFFWCRRQYICTQDEMRRRKKAGQIPDGVTFFELAADGTYTVSGSMRIVNNKIKMVDGMAAAFNARICESGKTEEIWGGEVKPRLDALWYLTPEGPVELSAWPLANQSTGK